MKDIMKYVKNNKFLCIALAIFFIFVLFLIQIKLIFFPKEESAIYGDRLKGIEKVKITKNKKDEVKSSLEEDDVVKNASISLTGKTIEIIITVNDEVDVNTAKGLGDRILGMFSDAEKGYYDFQLFIKKDNDSSEFPIIGYKQRSRGSFTFTKDRAVS